MPLYKNSCCLYTNCRLYTNPCRLYTNPGRLYTYPCCLYIRNPVACIHTYESLTMLAYMYIFQYCIAGIGLLLYLNWINIKYRLRWKHEIRGNRCSLDSFLLLNVHIQMSWNIYAVWLLAALVIYPFPAINIGPSCHECPLLISFLCEHVCWWHGRV